MGTTFSTIQIQNLQSLAQDEFTSALTEYFQKKGLSSASEDEADICYYLAFSKSISWVTLSSAEFDYGFDSEHTEVKALAEALKTRCIETSVYDSDTVLLFLYDALTKTEDTVVIGYADDMEEETDEEIGVPRGVRECWEPLLAEGKTWEQLTEAWNDEYIFTEDALSVTAELLGMDSDNIAFDYRVMEDEAAHNPLISALYFAGTSD